MTTVDAAESPARGVETRSPAGAVVSVIVPVTERPEHLGELYLEYAPVLRRRDRPFEFVFVTEAWGRDLTEPLRKLKADGEPIRIFHAGQTVGESMLLKAALTQCVGDLVVTLPSYARVVPEGIGELIGAVEGGVELASAVRDPRRDSWLNRLQNKLFHVLLRWGVGGDFTDVASGVRAMRRRVLEDVPLYGDTFRFLPLLARREGFRVAEVSVPQHPRDGKTRLYAPGTYLRRMIDLLGLLFLVRFTEKPLRFFGLVGSALAGAGSVILAVLFVQRLGGQSLAGRPLLLLGLLLAVLGVQAIALGLIGEIVVHLHASEQRSYRVLQPRSSEDG